MMRACGISNLVHALDLLPLLLCFSASRFPQLLCFSASLVLSLENQKKIKHAHFTCIDSTCAVVASAWYSCGRSSRCTGNTAVACQQPHGRAPRPRQYCCTRNFQSTCRDLTVQPKNNYRPILCYLKVHVLIDWISSILYREIA